MYEQIDIRNYKYIAIFPHRHPDGDALGSAAGLSLALKKQGIKSEIVIDDEIQPEIEFLREYVEFLDYDTAKSNSKNWDLCIAVDSADIERLHRRIELIKGKKILNIDHHVTNTMYGDINIVDSKAPAAAEIIYLYLAHHGFEIDSDIATCLYTGIVSDTGCFMYESTSPRTFRVAGELLSKEIDKAKIIIQLFQNKKKEKIKLQSEVLLRTRFFNSGSIAIGYIDKEILDKTNSRMIDSEGIIEQIRSIKGVETAILIKENTSLDKKEYFTKVSLRSKSKVDVSEIAKKFGGGGHVRASGFEIKKAKSEVFDALSKVLDLKEINEW